MHFKRNVLVFVFRMDCSGEMAETGRESITAKNAGLVSSSEEKGRIGLI